MPNLVRIENYPTRADAEVARGLLEANGIRATVWGHDGGGSPSGFVAWLTGEGDLVVLDHDVDEARAILDEARAVVTDGENGVDTTP